MKKYPNSFSINLYKLKITDKDAFLNAIDDNIQSKITNFKDYIDCYKREKSTQENCEIFIWAYGFKTKSQNEISWFKPWKKILGLSKTLRKKSDTYCGIFIFHFSNPDAYYAILNGFSYSVIEKYVDIEFGNKFFSLTFDYQSSVTDIIKKQISTMNNKSVQSYYKKNKLDFDVLDVFLEATGELTTKKDLPDKKYIENLLKYVKSKINVSNSCVNLTLKKDFTIKDLIAVILLVNQIITEYRDLCAFPYMREEDGLSDTLFAALLSQIIQDNNPNTAFNFSIPIFKKNKEDKNFFISSIDGFTICLNATEKEISLDLDEAIDFIQENKNYVHDIKQVLLKYGNYEDRFIDWIEGFLNYNNKDYYLYNGKWYTFSQNFNANLKRKIHDEICQVVQIKTEYDWSNSLDSEFIKNSISEMCQKVSELENTLKNKNHREFRYNYNLCKTKNFQCFDRKLLANKLEICDIDTGSSLLHVKIGNQASLQMALSQSIAGMIYYAGGVPKIKSYEDIDLSQNIANAGVLFLNKNECIDLENASLKTKILLIDWYQTLKKYGFQPVFYSSIFLEQ